MPGIVLVLRSIRCHWRIGITISSNFPRALGSRSGEDNQECGRSSTIRLVSLVPALCWWAFSAQMACVGPHDVCSASTWPLVTEMPSERDSWASDLEGSHSTHTIPPTPTTNVRLNQVLGVNDCAAGGGRRGSGGGRGGYWINPFNALGVPTMPPPYK